jgi:periplasmic protein TonB
MHAFDIDSAQGQLRRPLVWSFGLHLAFVVSIALAAFIQGFRGASWGSRGTGEAMGATLVSSIPLPAPPTETTNVVATESKGLAKSEPKAPEKEPDAIPIPDKSVKTKTKPVTTATQRKAEAEPPESNEVPYGEGGPAKGPYSMTAGSGQSGFASAGTGDFGSLFPWYVQAMARKIAENRQGVDSRITDAKRVYLTFEVARDGHVSHIELEQSSGVPVVDQAALNTLRRIDTFGPLPNEYSGSKLSAEWYFEPDWNKK